jgi:hypothetical protein
LIRGFHSSQYGLCFDLDQHFRRDQSLDLHHRRGWSDIPKELTVSPADFRPMIDVDDVHSGSHDVLQRGSCQPKSSIDIAKGLNRLGIGVTDPYDRSIGTGGRRPGDVHPLADADGP